MYKLPSSANLSTLENIFLQETLCIAMAIEKRYQNLTHETKYLLQIGENQKVEYKESVDGIKETTLVAFANSEHGGTILVGVKEEILENGAQVGQIIGTDIGDGTVLKILNRAINYAPPISIKINLENEATKNPILIVVISPSENKPHATSNGTYSIRDGNRNRPLHSNELLGMFLDSEGRAFAERFKSAADQINDRVAELENSLENAISDIGDQLGWAESKIDNSEDALDIVLGMMKSIKSESVDIHRRFRYLFKQDGRDDPVFETLRANIYKQLDVEISSNPNLMKKIKKEGYLIKMPAEDAYIGFTQDEITKICQDWVDEQSKSMSAE